MTAQDYYNPPQEMVDHYEKRNKDHVARVAANLRLFAKTVRDKKLREQIVLRAFTHDKSKFSGKERLPYIWLTEYFRCKRLKKPFTYPEGAKELVDAASDYHTEHNSHHPEAHKDINKMPDIDIIEMIGDWTAMAQEFKQDNGSAEGWAHKKIGTHKGAKWNFNKERTAFIYDTIATMDKVNEEKKA